MRKIHGDSLLLNRIEMDNTLHVAGVDDFIDRYDELCERFHQHFDVGFRENQIANSKFHKGRYIELARLQPKGKVIDVGNDKPFLSFYLKKLCPEAEYFTLSFDIPQTPYDLLAVDIEEEPLPFPDNYADYVLMSEVIEHLWRDPAFAIAQINRVLKPGGELYLTTPNACEMHAITCILWQANPNQRAQYFSTLESGHLHLWTSVDLRLILKSNGFDNPNITSFSPYGYTQLHKNIVDFVKSVSPYFDLMGEALLATAKKSRHMAEPVYPREIFPDGQGVKFSGAVEAFAQRHIRHIGTSDSTNMQEP